MDKLHEANAKARAMGLSYGQYKALLYQQQKQQSKPAEPLVNPRRIRPRRFTDPEAFALWQEGNTDAQIAAKFGVSRAIIQRWRDVLELPSTSKTQIDPKKYRLDQFPDGTYYATKLDTIK